MNKTGNTLHYLGFLWRHPNIRILGFLLIFISALLAVCSVSLVLPLKREVADLNLKVNALQQTLKSSDDTQQTLANLQKAQQELGDIEKKLLWSGGIADFSSVVYNLAAASNVEIISEKSDTVELDGGLSALHKTLDVSGDYQAIQKLVTQFRSAPLWITVNEVQLEAQNAGSLKAHLSIYAVVSREKTK